MLARSNYDIPFNRPALMGRELEYVAQAVESGTISGDGPFTQRCRTLLETLLGVPSVLLTTSCTHALEMAALLLDIEPGEEVIVPAFTFVSTVNAFVLAGAHPVFIDVRPDTLNLDERLLSEKLSSRTRAVVPVHYGGIGCEMESISAQTEEAGAVVIEDNAHGLLGRYRDRYLGTLGQLATLSFHETKNFSCGEGGALLINDERYRERAEIIREKGTNRSRFFRGEVDKYTWVDVGSSYLPSDLLAAYLFGQLEARDRIQSKRKAIWERYRVGLSTWATSNGVQLPIVPEECEPAYHLFHLVLPTAEMRTALIKHLKERGILSVFHYLPLHLSRMGKRFGGRAGECPVTESVSERLLRLPFYNDMREDEQRRVIEEILDFCS